MVSFLRITLGYNAGVSFSLFAGLFRDAPAAPGMLQARLLIFAGLLLPGSRYRLELAGLGPFTGGAPDNLVDRLRRGA